MLFNPKYKNVGLFGMSYFLFVEALGPLIEMFGYIALIVFYAFALIDRENMLLFFLFTFLWGSYITLSAIILDNFLYRRYSSLKDLLRLSLFGVIESFGYRQMITVERFSATFQFWRKGWGKVKRKEIHK